MTMFRTVYLVVALALLVACAGPSTDGTDGLASPDGRVRLAFTAAGGEDGNSLTYTVWYDDIEVVRDSPLGVILADGTELSAGLALASLEYGEGDETYDMPHGKRSTIRNHYLSALLSLADDSGRELGLEFRVFDDGVAFRYQFPETGADLELAGEATGFNFTADHRFWGLYLPDHHTNYESNYIADSIAHVPPDTLLALPVLVEIEKHVWCGITEADLTDYAAMYLARKPGVRPHFGAWLAPRDDGSGLAVRATLPHVSPWRVLMLGDDPGRLIESDIVLNLNDPPEDDFSWVKPGRAAWDWWSGQLVDNGETGISDTRTMQYYIDFAAELGLEYMLVDAGWYQWNGSVGPDAVGDLSTPADGIDIEELVRYGAERGVDIVLWCHWETLDEQLDTVLPLYERWGVKGIKVDFMDSDSQEMVDYYHRVTRKAAEHHLVVDFHGAYKPTGIRRTYPNLITREGALGLEFLKWSDRTSPEHNCTLPFVRMLAGPLDYTPGGFNNATPATFKSQNVNPMTISTRCHQLALFVILESAFQCVADSPANYRGEPGLEFLRHVPSAWDETRVLNAAVGDYCTIVRRRGDDWYLGSITDLTPRDLKVSLSFLGGGNWTAEIYADGPNAATDARDTMVGTEDVTARDMLTLSLAPGGGCAVRFFRK
jgi:alpha-glucosidase